MRKSPKSLQNIDDWARLGCHELTTMFSECGQNVGTAILGEFYARIRNIYALNITMRDHTRCAITIWASRRYHRTKCARSAFRGGLDQISGCYS